MTPEQVTIKPLVNVTPVAAQKLQALLAEKNLAGYGLRVFVSGGGCSGSQYGMAFENKTEDGDFVFDSQGVRVYLDNASAMNLEGAMVDYVDGPQGSGFSIENPNAASSDCSCGSGCSCGK
jgi:iron-sulfur cluster assembly protein